MSEWKTAGQGGGDVYDLYAEKKLHGIFKGTRENIGPNNSKMHDFEVKGALVSVWGSTVLDARLMEVKEGQEVKIEYLGKETNPETKRSFHNFNIEYRDVETGNKATPKTDKADEDTDDLPF